MRILETERLALDELEAADAAFILELVDGRGFRENIGDRGVRDLEGARGYIEGVTAGYAANGFGLWRAALKSSREPVGICGLVRRDGLEHPDVGYAILERFWGRGFATEAAMAIVEHGHRALGLPTLSAITAPTNEASIAVLSKIGFRFMGPVRLPGHEDESNYFEIGAP